MTSASTQSLRFVVDWAEGEGVKAPELRATWAALEIWIGADCLTLVQDSATESSRRAIYCPLYPLAEWIAFNWWFLNAHSRGPVPFTRFEPSLALNGSAAAWREKHNIRAAGDGFLWPNLTLVPEGELMSAEWRSDRAPEEGQSIRYMAHGRALLSAEETELSLANLVETVTARLNEAGIRETPLHSEWAAISATDSEERAYCLAASRLGVDPFDTDEETSEAIVNAGEALEEPILDELLDAVDPMHLNAGVSWVEHGTGRIHRIRGPRTRWLEKLRGKDLAGPSHYEMPWDTGWRQADFVRSRFRLKSTDALDMRTMFNVRRLQAPDESLLGLGAVTAGGSPAMVAGGQFPSRALRFLAARAVWHFVAEPDRDRFLLTTSYSGVERVARAFAAELLAPAVGIREVLGDRAGHPSEADIERVARHFQVSTVLVHRQIENQLSAVAGGI